MPVSCTSKLYEKPCVKLSSEWQQLVIGLIGCWLLEDNWISFNDCLHEIEILINIVVYTEVKVNRPTLLFARQSEQTIQIELQSRFNCLSP